MTSNPARSAKKTRPKDQLERPAAPERKTSENQLPELAGAVAAAASAPKRKAKKTKK